MYDEQCRQRVEAREDVSGSEIKNQERHERCRLNATREDLSRHYTYLVSLHLYANDAQLLAHGSSVCSGCVVVTAYDLESGCPGSNPEWGLIYY